MKHSIVNAPIENPQPARSEIASLALKFCQDSPSEDGSDRKSRLCAEYMLAQKQLIECQINSIHNVRENIECRWEKEE
jgi:hypothetical protein